MRGALWALGVLATLGGGGFAAVTIMAAMQSDAPQSGWPDGFIPGCVVCGVGAAMLVGGYYAKN